MSDLFGNHIVGFPTRRLSVAMERLYQAKELWDLFVPCVISI